MNCYLGLLLINGESEQGNSFLGRFNQGRFNELILHEVLHFPDSSKVLDPIFIRYQLLMRLELIVVGGKGGEVMWLLALYNLVF